MNIKAYIVYSINPSELKLGKRTGLDSTVTTISSSDVTSLLNVQTIHFVALVAFSQSP